MRTKSVAAFLALALTPLLLVATSARGDDSQSVKIKDKCDAATFNAAVPVSPVPGAPFFCDPAAGGGVTLDELFARLAEPGAPAAALSERNHLGWRFSPNEVTVDPGTTLLVHNEGGEAHTFTQVADFVGGCRARINAALGMTAPPQCSDANHDGVPDAFENPSVVLSGGSISVDLPNSGTLLFQCFLHPWMRTTVVVAGKH